MGLPMTVKQLRLALEVLDPENNIDPDTRVVLDLLPDPTAVENNPTPEVWPSGVHRLYCWYADMPDEGYFSLEE